MTKYRVVEMAKYDELGNRYGCYWAVQKATQLLFITFSWTLVGHYDNIGFFKVTKFDAQELAEDFVKTVLLANKPVSVETWTVASPLTTKHSRENS